jgi:hypothetical protein
LPLRYLSADLCSTYNHQKLPTDKTASILPPSTYHSHNLARDSIAETVCCKGALVYNLDERGFQEWADTHSMIIVMPAHYPGAGNAVSVDGRAKRVTILAAIKAGGDCLRPSRAGCDQALR